jgi:DNA-binding response OmpR family regulator
MTAFAGNRFLDASDYAVTPSGSLLLSPPQFRVLSLLLARPGALVTGQEVLAAIGAHDELVSGRSQDWHAAERRTL